MNLSGNTCKCGCGAFVSKRCTWIKGHNLRMERHHNWKGGIRHHSSGYIEIKLPDHPRAGHGGYVFEHILVMEEYLGRYLEKEEISHHCNSKKEDNRIENLELMLEHYHKIFHNQNMPKEARIKMTTYAKSRPRNNNGRFIKITP